MKRNKEVEALFDYTKVTSILDIQNTARLLCFKVWQSREGCSIPCDNCIYDSLNMGQLVVQLLDESAISKTLALEITLEGIGYEVSPRRAVKYLVKRKIINKNQWDF